MSTRSLSLILKITRILLANRCDPNKLTPANLASLRWDNALTDSKLESERIERYKELRRQRYMDAREQAIEIILEQLRLTTAADPSNMIEAEAQ